MVIKMKKISALITFFLILLIPFNVSGEIISENEIVGKTFEIEKDYCIISDSINEKSKNEFGGISLDDEDDGYTTVTVTEKAYIKKVILPLIIMPSAAGAGAVIISLIKRKANK